MADANTLAAAIEAEMTAYSAGSGEDEPHIIVNDDRSITVPDELKHIGVQYDKDIETVTIDCPRYWDGHDLSQMHLFVNFVHYEPNKKTQYYVDIAPVTLAEAGAERMLLDWTIGASAMRYEGTLAWLVCAKSLDAEGHEELHWNSQICYDMQVYKGLEYNDENVQDHDFVAAALEQILAAAYETQGYYQETERAAQDAKNASDSALKSQEAAAQSQQAAAQSQQAAAQSQAAAADSAAAAEQSRQEAAAIVSTDLSLTIEGAPADAAAAGIAIAAAQSNIYELPVLASGWTGEEAPYVNTIAAAGVTEDTVLSDITLAPASVGNAESEAAARSWDYLDTIDGAVVLYSDTVPEADFVILAREVK